MIHRSYYVKTGFICCKFANRGLGITFFFPSDLEREIPPPLLPKLKQVCDNQSASFCAAFQVFRGPTSFVVLRFFLALPAHSLVSVPCRN